MHYGIAFLSLLAIPVWDRGFVNGWWTRRYESEFRYWPFTKTRWASIVALAAGTFTTFLLMSPPDSRNWVTYPFIAGLLIHWFVAEHELRRQRRR